MAEPTQGMESHWEPSRSTLATDAPLRSWPVRSSREGRMQVVREAVRLRLEPYSALLLRARSLVLWERPLHSALLHVAVVFCCFALPSFRPLFLMCISLAVAVCVDMWNIRTRPKIKSCPPNENERQDAAYPGTFNVFDLSHHIAEVYVSASNFVRSLVIYRRQNPCQFCFLACCFLTFLAILGHYIPGPVLSYAAVLLLLLCPLPMNHGIWHQLPLLLEVVLQWMGFSSHDYMMSRPKECTNTSGSNSVHTDAPSTSMNSRLNFDSLSTAQPHPIADTCREDHSNISTSQTHAQQPISEPDFEWEDFEILDQLELHSVDPLGQN